MNLNISIKQINEPIHAQRDRAINFLANLPNTPFLAIISTPSAHAPFTAAARHAHLFQHEHLVATPNLNWPSTELEKHWLLRMQPARLPDSSIELLRQHHIHRWQTLVAVDELVGDVVEHLRRNGQLEHTHILFTSDNGFHLGQFAQGADKRQPYETDIRVPMLWRGPGISARTIVRQPVALIDVMPTMLQLAGIESPPTPPLDGESFVDALLMGNNNNDVADEVFRRQILIEYWGEGTAETTFADGCDWSANDRLAGCSAAFACHCEDSWNNSYACIREMSDGGNSVNYLFCQFQDNEVKEKTKLRQFRRDYLGFFLLLLQQFVEAYDLRVDPYEMDNLAFSMLPSEQAWWSRQLDELKSCVGATCHRKATTVKRK